MAAQQASLAPLHQPDTRADNGEREVSIARSHVLIARRLRGMRMKVRVEARDFAGVILSAPEGETGGLHYRVSLWHPDSDLNVTLLEASDDTDVTAAWNEWANFFALPKLIERAPGRIEIAEARLGAVALGGARAPRRRGAIMTRRRSRMALRRRAPLELRDFSSAAD